MKLYRKIKRQYRKVKSYVRAFAKVFGVLSWFRIGRL